MQMKKEPTIKYRHEYKFIISEAQSIILQNRLNCIMQLDQNIDEGNQYRIRSVYFDDYVDSCLYQNEAGTDPRGKWRIRIYNESDRRIRLEHKVKNRGMTFKESELISKEQTLNLLNSKVVLWNEIEKGGALEKFATIYAKGIFKPKIIVDYVRIPFVDPIGNVRITFDKCLLSSNMISDFFEKNIQARAVMPSGMLILEVKYDELLPQYIKTCLNIGELQQTSYSKYYLCRKFHL